jgi:uncharacterized protein
VSASASGAGLRQRLREHRLLAFGGLVVVLTGLVAVAGLDRNTAPFALIFVPAVSALVVAGLADGRPAIGRLFRRITRWRVAPRWYAAALGIPLVMWLGVVGAGIATGVPVSELFGDLGSVPLVLLVVLVPALVEEFGWRGYAVPVAPRAWPMLATALVVGGLFIIPHLALYLPGGLYDNLPLWPLPFILLSYGVLLTWVFVGSGGSSLIAALMHAAFNGLTPLSRGIDPVREWELHGLVVAVIAIAVVILSPSLRRAIVERREPGGSAPITLESPA